MNSQIAKTTNFLSAHASVAPVTVACLCAAWCGVCKQYEPEFKALQSKYPAVHFVWIDVEDDEELVGDLDIETFPTLLIGQDQAPWFFGPLLPQMQVLERLLASLQGAEPQRNAISAEALELWQRLMSN